MKFDGERIIIVGEGISGQGAFTALRARGADCFFYASPDDFERNIDLVVVSPGIPSGSEVFRLAKEKKIPILGELEIGYLLCDKPIIAVTGTNGKTTITELIGTILGYDNRKALVCGNIGTAFSSATLTEDYDVAVVEVSSFQLETIIKFKPSIAIISNITEDHLDRHKTLNNYIKAKFKIAKNQTQKEHLIVPSEVLNLSPNQNNPFNKIKSSICHVDTTSFGHLSNDYAKCEQGYSLVKETNHPSEATKHSSETTNHPCEATKQQPDCYEQDGKIYFKSDFVAHCDDIGLKGQHNLINCMLALTACKLFGVSDTAIRLGLKLFKPRAYRMALSGEHLGTKYYNDSKGTNIDACLCACRAMPKNTCLIVGGSDKGYNFDKLFSDLPIYISKVFVVGETAPKILESAKNLRFSSIEQKNSIREATIAASKLNFAAVLLSPAAASFDSYKNYEERGKDFDNTVGEIMQIDSKKWTI